MPVTSYLWGAGGNNAGQLGDNTNENKSSPVQTVAYGNNWYFISKSMGKAVGVINFGTKIYDTYIRIDSSKVYKKSNGLIFNGLSGVSINFDRSDTRLLPARTMKILVNNVQKASASFDKSYIGNAFIFTDTTGLSYNGNFNAGGEIRFT